MDEGFLHLKEKYFIRRVDASNAELLAPRGCEWCMNRHLRSARQVRIVWEFEDDYSSGAVVDKLAYCPFCGTKLVGDDNETD